MSAATSNISSSPGALPTSSVVPFHADSKTAVNPADIKASELMGEIVLKKEKNKETRLEKRWDALEVIFVGGNAFSMGYLGFSGAQAFHPALKEISAIVLTSSICGIVAGGIEMLGAMVFLKQGFQELKNGNMAGARIQFYNFVGYFLIGLVMMIASIGALLAKNTAFGAASAFLLANPFILPLLFFIVNIPMFYQVLKNVGRNITGAAPGMKILHTEIKGKDPTTDQTKELDQLINDLGLDQSSVDKNAQTHEEIIANAKAILKEDQRFAEAQQKLIAKLNELSEKYKDKTGKELADLIRSGLQEGANAALAKNVEDALNSEAIASEKACVYNYLSRKFEELSPQMGVEAAMETFKFLGLYRQMRGEKDATEQSNLRTKTVEQLEVAKGKIKRWNNIQLVRLAQRVMNLAAFALSTTAFVCESIGTTIPELESPTAALIRDSAMVGTNLIPLILDWFYPFARNSPMVIPKATYDGVELQKLHPVNGLQAQNS